MQIKREDKSSTSVVLTITAEKADMSTIKVRALNKLAPSVKAPGFREGKVPANIVEKYVDQQKLQSEFLDEAINELFNTAIIEQKLRPLDQPNVTLKKFVPFTQLEFDAQVEILGPIRLSDYKKLNKKLEKQTVSSKEVDEVLDNLATRQAEKKEVKRASKNTDEIWIDFKGVDKDKKPVTGAEGKDYPLVLGSKTFIPGFEEQLIGKKAGDKKTFDVTFPRDYGVKKLANQKVTFTVTVKKVEEVTKPKIDDKLAKKAGPFETLEQLKKDIKAQLLDQKQTKARQDLEAEIIKQITDSSDVDVPDGLIANQSERILAEIKRDVTYRGQTFPEFLAMQDKTEEQYIEDVVKPDAKTRVKAGLVLAEIAEKEKIFVTPEELQKRIDALKGQYTDEAMQTELNKPESRREIHSRLMTEKTIQKVFELATS